MKLIFYIGFLFLSLNTFAQPKVESLFSSICGRFSNEKQVKKLPDSVATKITSSKPWVNTLFANHLPIKKSTLGSHVLFLEWREDSSNGKISRQRIWSFKTRENGELLMNFYAFKIDSLWKNASLNPQLLSDIRLNDLVEYPSGCHLPITKNKKIFIAILDSNTCKVVTQKTQRVMKLFAEITIRKKGFSYKEKGILENGIVVFDVPKYEKYLFKKLK